MEEVESFYGTLFSTQTPAARQYFELRKDECFVPDSGKIRAFVDTTSAFNDSSDPEGIVSLSEDSPSYGLNPRRICKISRIEDLSQFTQVSKNMLLLCSPNLFQAVEGSSTTL
jgi:hypothetical protein